MRLESADLLGIAEPALWSEFMRIFEHIWVVVVHGVREADSRAGGDVLVAKRGTTSRNDAHEARRCAVAEAERLFDYGAEIGKGFEGRLWVKCVWVWHDGIEVGAETGEDRGILEDVPRPNCEGIGCCVGAGEEHEHGITNELGTACDVLAL